MLGFAEELFNASSTTLFNPLTLMFDPLLKYFCKPASNALLNTIKFSFLILPLTLAEALSAGGITLINSAGYVKVALVAQNQTK